MKLYQKSGVIRNTSYIGIMTELLKGQNRSGTVSSHFATMHQHDHNYCKQHHQVTKIGYIVNVTLHMTTLRTLFIHLVVYLYGRPIIIDDTDTKKKWPHNRHWIDNISTPFL